VLEVRFWCHECRRLACCSAACLKALQDIHEPWCKGGRPIGPVGHASTAPRPSAVILKEVANKLAVSGEQQHRTQNAISSLVSLLKPELVQLTAGYQRYAVGGSFAKLTAMQFKFDVDLVLLFGFESTTKANFASDHAELIDRVEEILCRIQGLDIIGRSSKCIQCRWKSNKLDVLVGRLFGALQHCKTRTPDDLASTILQLQDGYNADARSRLSPSFTECSVQFMSSQPLAVLRAIRLVKFWKHVSIAGEISSCKTIFESPPQPSVAHCYSYTASTARSLAHHPLPRYVFALSGALGGHSDRATRIARRISLLLRHGASVGACVPRTQAQQDGEL
jgi:hypothetical protein